MKIKSFLIMVLSLISLTVAAQNGGIKGKVVSRATRTAIDGVKVTLTPGNVTTTTDEKGYFIFENLNKGEYSLAFEAAEYEPLSIAVRVDKLIRDINNVVLVPDNQSPTVDDAILQNLIRRLWTMPNHCLHHCRHPKMYSTTSLPTNSARCVSTFADTTHAILMYT